MGMARTCDSCGATITGDPTQIILPSDGTVAGAMIDLCKACSDAVRKDAKITKAKDNFTKRNTTPQG